MPTARSQGSNRRTYVLDTSVLLSDPRAMLRFDEHDVVIPVVVVTELEAKRSHPELGYFARQALRLMDDLRVENGRLDEPMPVGDLHAAVLRLCGLDSAPLWNPDKALRALAQNPQAVASLKTLFQAEVPAMSAAVRAALDAGDLKTLGDVLHKLKASCGFLGAERLLAECRALEAAPGPEALARFECVCAETLAAI